MAGLSFTIAEHGFRNRRGVLLLIVLSMLSLFMMLGVAFVIMASRARDASRGFARAIAPSAGTAVPASQLLDSAAMLLIRGTNAALVSPPFAPPAALTGGSPVSFESLLEDQFGTSGTLLGQVASFNDFSPLCSVDVTLSSGAEMPTHPVQLSGRILTFLPSTGKASSHRILRASSNPNGGYTLWIANTGNAFSKRGGEARGQAANASAYNFPAAETKIVINGREHSGSGTAKNEAWDGFDNAHNSFLAQVEPTPATPSSSLVIRASMTSANGVAIDSAGDVDGDLVPDLCDNDNDGIVDGQFFDPGFPKLLAANGNQIVTHMSCLIVDLDGRLNANAHGSIASSIYPNSHTGWPAPPGPWATMPLGSGYGPAEISGTSALAALNAARPVPQADTPASSLLMGAQPAMQYASVRTSGQGSQANSSSSPDQGCRLLPLGLPALEGRYGGQAQAAAPASNTTMAAQVALPGVNNLNDMLSTYNEFPYAGVRSPIDLQGRMKSRAIAPVGQAIVPTLSFAKPDNSPEFIDDPYEIVLPQGKGGGNLADPQTMGLAVGALPDNVFSVAELERVLRPYDPDSATLPPRLFALLGSQAEVGRLAFTTESWDTPVITGSAALTLFGTSGWLSSVAPGVLHSTTGPQTATSGTLPNGVVPPDFAAGLRLDVTRTGTNELQKRALFKDLYLACVAMLTGSGSDPAAATAVQYAQWAANVVEYQDADSTMTQFEYDPKPFTNGWDVDGDPTTTSESTRAVVWGAERPEAVITQTLAWDDGTNGELYVVLHRPWNSRLEIPGSAPISAEPTDPSLRATPTAPDNSICLSATTPAGEPVWQLRLGTGAAAPIVRFDPLPVSSTDLGATVSPPPPFVSQFTPDSWICVSPSAASKEGVVVPPTLQTFRVSSGVLKAPVGTTVVRLERIANPKVAFNATTNPYLVVDAADITIVARTPTTPPPHQVRTRDQGWNQHFDSAPYPTKPLLSGTWGGNPAPAWMMWPNRPLVSVVELMHVPGFAANSFMPQDASAASSPANGMLANYTPPVGLAYLPVPGLLEALRVPSRFAGTRLTIPDIPNNAQFLTNLESIGLYKQIVSVNQLDLGREPGRVNLNTISSDAVWDELVKGSLLTSTNIPKRDTAHLVGGTNSSPAAPAETMLNVLSVSSGGNTTPPLQDVVADISDAADNPLHRMHTATRLANTATNRSHLFAVWITLRTMEQTPTTTPVRDPDTARYHRMFFIYDRSKPVAFETGKDHNVRDGIVLKRVLQ